MIPVSEREIMRQNNPSWLLGSWKCHRKQILICGYSDISIDKWFGDCLKCHYKRGVTVSGEVCTIKMISSQYINSYFSAVHAGMRERVAVLYLRTHSWWRVPFGRELGGTGRQVSLEIHAGTDGAPGKSPPPKLFSTSWLSTNKHVALFLNFFKSKCIMHIISIHRNV